jgi:hypothetical protein
MSNQKASGYEEVDFIFIFPHFDHVIHAQLRF